MARRCPGAEAPSDQVPNGSSLICDAASGAGGSGTTLDLPTIAGHASTGPARRAGDSWVRAECRGYGARWVTSGSPDCYVICPPPRRDADKRATGPLRGWPT